LLGVILVVEYGPAWPRRFEQLRRDYAAAMAAVGVPVVAIEHVGSTSVPGLAAKPVIDCDIVVAEQDVTAGSGVLTGLGFKPLGELGIPLRWAFKEPERLAGTNTYIVVAGSLSCATIWLSGLSLNGASCHAADRVRGQARGAEQASASGLIGNGGTQRRPELPGSGEEAFRHEGMRANHR
jgi:GrpB protein